MSKTTGKEKSRIHGIKNGSPKIIRHTQGLKVIIYSSTLANLYIQNTNSSRMKCTSFACPAQLVMKIIGPPLGERSCRSKTCWKVSRHMCSLKDHVSLAAGAIIKNRQGLTVMSLRPMGKLKNKAS